MHEGTIQSNAKHIQATHANAMNRCVIKVATTLKPSISWIDLAHTQMDPPMNFSPVRVFTLDELKFIFRIVYILLGHFIFMHYNQCFMLFITNWPRLVFYRAL